ncbi:hypothetical protein ES705_04683 [subsurface metagenome]
MVPKYNIEKSIDKLSRDISCRKCGKCCYAEIPITIPDINRIAIHFGIADRKAFNEYIQRTVSSKSSLFKIQKTETRACVFLSKKQLCIIHKDKPMGCKFYRCNPDVENENLLWPASCIQPDCQIGLWDYSIARKLTKAYRDKNGINWNEEDYLNVLRNFRENSSNKGLNRVKLSRDVNGAPFAIIYDCSKCKMRGTQAVETPVTIDDIVRIIRHLNMDGKSFFQEKISTHLSSHTGCFKLIRKKFCIFHGKDGHCTIKQVRPMHCHFNPCPIRVKNAGMMDQLYLGSGTIEQQFRHQVALTLTREYIDQYGIEYNINAFRQTLKRVDGLSSNRLELQAFNKKLGLYRYIETQF